MKNGSVFILFLVFTSITHAQNIKGRIIDSKNGEPISGASIYIDGTSKGVITDLDGYFSFYYPEGVNSALVIRMMGYEMKRFASPLDSDLSIIMLVQKADELEAVVLELDPWSREKKERLFKQYFLGSTALANDCEILNLDKVRLRFNPVTALMTAKCSEPIIVKNNYLGYLITYDLVDFELIFTKINIDTLARQMNIQLNGLAEKEHFKIRETFYTGSTFFQDLHDKPSTLKKYNKRRKKMFKVSMLRFFRTLADNRLREDGYFLIYDKFSVEPKIHLRVRKLNNFSYIAFRNKKYSIIDSEEKQTDIYLTGEQLVIDEYGNNMSGRDIKFTGYMADLRVSGMLPLDYNPEKN